jgi:hypothetical protein
MFISAMVLTVVSNVLYHIFQKMTPSNVNPLLSLATRNAALANNRVDIAAGIHDYPIPTAARLFAVDFHILGLIRLPIFNIGTLSLCSCLPVSLFTHPHSLLQVSPTCCIVSIPATPVRRRFQWEAKLAK